MTSFTVMKPALHTCRYLVSLVLVGLALLAQAADPPQSSPPTTPYEEVSRKLGDLRRDAFRITPSKAGAEAVTTLYVGTFRKLGFFSATNAAQQVVTKEDCVFLQEVVTRHAAMRRDILNTLDHWMFFLEQSDERDGRIRTTLTLLRDYAERLEVDDLNGLPLRQIRKAVVARDLLALTSLFDGEKPLHTDLLRKFPGCLYAEVHTVLQQSSNQVALWSLKKLLRLQPTDPALNMLMAKASNSPIQSTRYAHALLLSDPSNPAFHLLMGQTLFDAATQPHVFRPVIRHFRDSYDAAGVGEAIEHLHEAVRLNADQNRLDPAAHCQLGVAYEYSHEWQTGQAVVAFETAIREAALAEHLSDDGAIYHLALAQALQNLGRDPNRVIREAEQCITLCKARPQPPTLPVSPKPGVIEPFVPSGPEELAMSYLVVGRAYLDLGRATDAVASLTMAVRHRPKSEHTWFWLAKAYFACGHTKHAIEAATNAHKFDKLNPEILSALGQFALAEGNAKQAKEWFCLAKQHAAKSSRISSWQPSPMFLTDEGIALADELATFQRDVAKTVAPAKAIPTVTHAQAAATQKHYTEAARIFQTLLKTPEFEDATGEVVRFAVGTAVRAGRDGLFGDCDRASDAQQFHALARTWADEELNRLRAVLAKVLHGNGNVTREALLARLSLFQTDPLLAAVREPDQRAKLGAAERRSWESFWDAWNEIALTVRGLRNLNPPNVDGPLGGGLGGF